MRKPAKSLGKGVVVCARLASWSAIAIFSSAPLHFDTTLRFSPTTVVTSSALRGYGLSRC